jgi:endo-alpha-1,4-polygalactosaminidase (GH114 family)
MARLLPLVLAAALLAGLSDTVEAQAAGGRKARLTEARSFTFAIGDGTLNGNLSQRYAPFDLVVTDGESASAKDVATIRQSGGGLVLAYLDVGTIEDYRGWYNAAKPYRLDYWGE